MKLLLIGNYGVGNLGDEALKTYFLERFPEHQWNVISANPLTQHEVPRLPLGLRSLFRPWWRTLVAYLWCDAVVFGGGSLFTDVESIFACLLWWVHAIVARVLGKSRYFAFQGVGPFHSSFASRAARSAFVGATFISVRDDVSVNRTKALTRCPILQTADPISLLFFQAMPSLGEILVLVPRANSGEAFLTEVRSVLKARQPTFVRLVLLQPDAERHIADVLQLLLKEVQNDIQVERCPTHTLEELILALRGASFVLSERYHASLTALMLGVPYHSVSQGEGDKLSTLRTGEHDPAFAALLREQARAGEGALKEALLK